MSPARSGYDVRNLAAMPLDDGHSPKCLPTAQIISERDGVYTIRAETFGNGIDMWLRSQGKDVRLIR